jgi:hypothetical protein
MTQIMSRDTAVYGSLRRPAAGALLATGCCSVD